MHFNEFHVRVECAVSLQNTQNIKNEQTLGFEITFQKFNKSKPRSDAMLRHEREVRVGRASFLTWRYTEWKVILMTSASE